MKAKNAARSYRWKSAALNGLYNYENRATTSLGIAKAASLSASSLLRIAQTRLSPPSTASSPSIVSDIARSREFYSKAFGWTFTSYGPTYCEFSDGRLTGGLAKGGPINPGGPLVILYPNDLAEAQRRLEDAGAKIVKPVFSFPGGRRFHFHDLDGHELAVWSDR
jgi:predicted enzyme related to lactoylglutathione lyase